MSKKQMLATFFLLLVIVLSLDFAIKKWSLEQVPFIQRGQYPYGGMGVFDNILGVSFVYRIV